MAGKDFVVLVSSQGRDLARGWLDAARKRMSGDKREVSVVSETLPVVGVRHGVGWRKKISDEEEKNKSMRQRINFKEKWKGKEEVKQQVDESSSGEDDDEKDLGSSWYSSSRRKEKLLDLEQDRKNVNEPKRKKRKRSKAE